MANVLLVVGNPAALTAKDTWLSSRLTGLGHTVTVADDSAAVPADVSSLALVVFAESMAGAQVSKWDPVTVPIVGTAWHQPIHSQASSQSFASTGDTRLTRSFLASPVTALTGAVTVYGSTPAVGYLFKPLASLAPGVTVYAQEATTPARPTGVYIEAGAALLNGATCPSRRAVLAAHEVTSVNATGAALFDDLVDWAIGVDATPPAVPADLAALITSSVTLTWDPSTDDTGVTGYEVHRSTSSDFTPAPSTLLDTVAGTSYIDEGLPDGAHHYRVVALDEAGNSSAPSAAKTVTIGGEPAPPAVLGYEWTGTELVPLTAFSEAPAVLPARGPNGLRTPPHTPAYDTPATRTASTFSELQTQLDAAVSGDVIEVTGNITGAQVTLARGSTSWATNVLIRPPLGQRRTIENMRINAAHVTVAGFDCTLMHLYLTPIRSVLWRIVSQDGFSLGYADDCGVVECVAPSIRYDVTGDTIQGLSTSGVVRYRPYVIGCWFAASTLPEGSSAHLDTLQLEGIGAGGGIVDPVVRDNVLCGHPTANVALLVAPNCTNAIVDNNYVGACKFYSAALGGAGLQVTDNDFDMSINFTTAPAVAQGNTIDADSQANVSNGADGNTVALGSVVGPDPLGDLTVLWPECPSTAVGQILG